MYSWAFSGNLSKTGWLYETDKCVGHHYVAVYQKFLKHLRFKKINFLEIGIGGYEDPEKGGESLKMWRRFFPFANLYALDFYEKRCFKGYNTKIYQGSQADPKVLDQIVKDAQRFDVILDDGSHINWHVIATFEHMYKHVVDGGYYIIEDTQTSYWPDYGGSGENKKGEFTMMEYFLKIANRINYEEFVPRVKEPSYFDLNIKSMHFYHNLIIIQKGSNTEGSNYLQW